MDRSLAELEVTIRNLDLYRKPTGDLSKHGLGVAASSITARPRPQLSTVV
jgi:hypothetical protein